jgi:hypothetical protein
VTSDHLRIVQNETQRFLVIMKTELLDYMRRHRLVVRSSIGSQGEPQAALVGIVGSPAYEVVFDTVNGQSAYSRPRRRSLPNAGLGFFRS